MIRPLLLPALLLVIPSSAMVGSAQQPGTVEPRFRIGVAPNAQGGPHFTLTNLSGKTLAACHVRFSVSAKNTPQLSMSWDTVVEGGHPQSPAPLTPGASMTMYLPHEVAGPLPDKGEVLAGIWGDGETFGDALWVKQLLESRAQFAFNYEQAIAFLQKGLDNNWTRSQYLEALDAQPKSGLFLSIRRTMQTNKIGETDSRTLPSAVQTLLTVFSKRLTQLREAKPAITASTRSYE